MNIDQRMREIEDKASAVQHEYDALKAELAALKAEVAKPAEEEMKPGEWVIMWDDDEDRCVLVQFKEIVGGLGFRSNGVVGCWLHARRPTPADWLKLGAPVLDIDRLFRENPDAKVITQDEKGMMQKWNGDPKPEENGHLWAGLHYSYAVKVYPDWKTRIWHRPEGI